MNADASILSGNVDGTTLRKAILGANQGRNLLDLTTKTNTDAYQGRSLRESVLAMRN